ncbi:MAG: hypothetical protein AABZ01_00855 [Gemmatimonadota bacterium]
MRTLRLAGTAAILVLIAAGCKGTGTTAAIPSDSTAFYRTQSENMAALSMEKDSLLRELTETTRLITDVSVELATIRTAPASNAPVVGSEGIRSDERAEVLAKVRQLTARIRQSESRLATTRRRLDSLALSSDSLRSSLAAYVATVADLEGMLADQKTTIQTLTDQIGALTQQNVQLAAEKAELQDTVSHMDQRENEVYYVIGTKKELMSRGIISEEGGTRFLIFTRTGETLVPAAVLDPAQFTKADRRTLTELAMPNANRDYRVISRHDLAYAEADRMSKGKFRGTLRITAPVSFWGPSKFLIIVEN